MGTNYRLTGSVGPGSRIDRVEVEPPSADNPEGKVLEMDADRVGPGIELTDEQFARLSQHVRLERVEEDAPEAGVLVVDQPGVDIPSQSTAGDPGTTPNVDNMSHAQLVAELDRLGDVDVNKNAGDDNIKAALRERYAEKGVN